MRVVIRWRSSAWRQVFVSQPELFSPLPPGVRIAVLSDGFRDTKYVRAFPSALSPALMAFEPQALAAPLTVLRALAHTIQRGLAIFPVLSHALIVLTDVDGELMRNEDRDLLWAAFGLPLYEQLIGPRGETLASECEAHHGLHVIHPDCPTEHLARMLATELSHSTCGCGRRGARFVPQTPVLAPRPTRVIAAAAGTAA